jgi:hypothetical protein
LRFGWSVFDKGRWQTRTTRPKEVLDSVKEKTYTSPKKTTAQTTAANETTSDAANRTGDSISRAGIRLGALS